jgi:hypothetical protein
VALAIAGKRTQVGWSPFSFGAAGDVEREERTSMKFVIF